MSQQLKDRTGKFDNRHFKGLERLQDEASQLLKITLSSRKTARGNIYPFDTRNSAFAI